MEIKIGMRQTQREISLVSQESSETIAELVTKAVSDGSVLSLTDERGRQVMVPAAGLAYVELGEPHTRSVGFAI